MVANLAALPDTFDMDVEVLPWVPLDSMGYRVQGGAKKLKTKLTVKFLFYATGKDALKGVECPDMDPKDASALGPQRRTEGTVIRTSSAPAQNPPPPFPLVLPSQLSRNLPLNPPQVPGLPTALNPAGLADGNLVARMLTGQPIPSNLLPTNLTSALSAAAGALPTTGALAGAGAPAPNSGSPVIVMPPSQPIVMVAPQGAASKKKPKSRIHRLLGLGSGSN